MYTHVVGSSGHSNKRASTGDNKSPIKKKDPLQMFSRNTVSAQ